MEGAPARDPADRVPQALPVFRILDALDRWQREPADDSRAAVAAALEVVTESTGARGLRLILTATPFVELDVGVGTLTVDGGRGQRDERGASFDLASNGSHPAVGRAVVDAPPGTAEAIVRVLELAVDAAWSRAEVHRRAERLAALEAATRAVAAELDIDRVLQLIVDLVRGLVGARFAALGITDRRGRIERFLTSGVSAAERASIGEVPHGRGVLGLIIREGRTIRAEDLAEHPESFGFPRHHPAMTSFLGAPILANNRSVGNLYLADKERDQPFTEDDEHLVEMFAVHAGIAIDNARLHDQVQRLAVVEERERIGKDLHDGIIQSIYAVGLSLEDVPDLIEDDRTEAVARVDRAIDALNLVIGDIRSYILRLRPMLGGDEDTVEALARLGEEVRIHAVVDLDVDLAGGADALRALPPDRRSDILFIAREAFSNVARHAAATRARLLLDETGGTLRLEIADNGRGFDPETVEGPDPHGRHQGLTNMRDRALGMGGTFAVECPEGMGTRIIVRVPASPDVQSGDRPPPGTGESRS